MKLKKSVVYPRACMCVCVFVLFFGFRWATQNKHLLHKLRCKPWTYARKKRIQLICTVVVVLYEKKYYFLIHIFYYVQFSFWSSLSTAFSFFLSFVIFLWYVLFYLFNFTFSVNVCVNVRVCVLTLCAFFSFILIRAVISFKYELKPLLWMFGESILSLHIYSLWYSIA